MKGGSDSKQWMEFVCPLFLIFSWIESFFWTMKAMNADRINGTNGIDNSFFENMNNGIYLSNSVCVKCDQNDALWYLIWHLYIYTHNRNDIRSLAIICHFVFFFIFDILSEFSRLCWTITTYPIYFHCMCSFYSICPKSDWRDWSLGINQLS